MTPTNPQPPNSSILKETRVAKGLTLEIVHEATKIPMDALKAIEEGYSTRILTPFYYRGFVKIYAEFLGLNSADVLKEYNIKPPEIKTPGVTRPVVKAKTVAVQVDKKPNAFAEQAGEFWGRFWTPKTRKNLLRVVLALVALFVLVKLTGCVVHAIKSRPKSPPKAAVSGKVTKKPVAVVKKEQPKAEVKMADDEEEQAAKEKSMPAQSQNHKVTLTVHAPKDAPIQVKADGKIIFQMTMKKGTIENWEANNQIEISGRNIGELDMEVNGKDIGNLTSSNRRAKRAVITKDGLTVKK